MAVEKRDHEVMKILLDNPKIDINSSYILNQI